jgi:hypothetical protein
MADKRQYKDPSRSYAGAGEVTVRESRNGYWHALEMRRMDDKFRKAMATAIKSGAEHCATEPSTHFGTRAPVAGYQRDG